MICICAWGKLPRKDFLCLRFIRSASPQEIDSWSLLNARKLSEFSNDDTAWVAVVTWLMLAKKLTLDVNWWTVNWITQFTSLAYINESRKRNQTRLMKAVDSDRFHVLSWPLLSWPRCFNQTDLLSLLIRIPFCALESRIGFFFSWWLFDESFLLQTRDRKANLSQYSTEDNCENNLGGCTEIPYLLLLSLE